MIRWFYTISFCLVFQGIVTVSGNNQDTSSLIKELEESYKTLRNLNLFKRNARYQDTKDSDSSGESLLLKRLQLALKGYDSSLDKGKVTDKRSVDGGAEPSKVEGMPRTLEVMVVAPDVQLGRNGHAEQREFNRLSRAVANFRDMFQNGSFAIPTTDRTICSDILREQYKENYMKTMCKRLEGKIVCKAGRFTFVINNGDYELEPRTVANFVGLLYKRIRDGDRSFVISVEDKTTQSYRSRRYSSEDNELPVTVECTPVSMENVTMMRPFEQPTEVVFECVWHLLGLKKRAVDNRVGLKYPCPTYPLKVRNYKDSCGTTQAGALCPTESPLPSTTEPCVNTCPSSTTPRCGISTCKPSCPSKCTTATTTCHSHITI